MSRKTRKIIPPSSVSTDVNTLEYKTSSQDEFKQLVEKEYAPEPIVEPKKVRTFLGCGTYLPKINGKTVSVSFADGNKYSAHDSDVIEYLIKKGFKEAL